MLVTEINECESSPCRNDGTCVDQIDAYLCSCVSGYTDPECSTGEHYSFLLDVTQKVLSEQPLQQHVCFFCHTAMLYIYIRHVRHVKCCGHILVSIDVMTSCYTSDITVSLYALLQQCWSCITVRISELKTCSSNPCLHGGACIDGDNGFTCDCTTTGYYGQLCQHISLTPSKNCYFSVCVSCVCVFL